jgi:hypothetical protein
MHDTVVSKRSSRHLSYLLSYLLFLCWTSERSDWLFGAVSTNMLHIILSVVGSLFSHFILCFNDSLENDPV